MASFDPKSRYVRHASSYEVTDRRGRKVLALTPGIIPPQTELGEHILKQGQRLDHLANFYLKDPNGFWRIAEQNGAMLPDAVLQQTTVRIPSP
jgi:hypothetical protein